MARGASSGGRPTGRRQRKQVQHYTDSNPSTFTTKKPRGSPELQELVPPKRGRRRKRPVERTTSSTDAAAASVKDPPSPEPELEDHVLPHAVDICPIFPPPPPPVVVPSNNDEDSVLRRLRLDPSTKLAFGRGLGAPRPVPKPQWTQVRYHDFHHPLDFDSEGKLHKDATLVTRAVTTCACSENYVIIGDTAGFVVVYSSVPTLLPFALLSTSASRREHVQLKQSNKVALKKSTKYGFRVPDIKASKSLASQHPNAIHALCMLGIQVCVSTLDEVEVIDASKNVILWTFPLNENPGPPTKVDLHANGRACLASFWCNPQKATTEKAPAVEELCFTPLLRIQPQNNDDDTTAEACAVVPKNDETPLRLGPKCAALWDKANDDRIVMVTLVFPKEDDILPVQELLLVDRQSFSVLKRAPVPLKVMGPKTVSTEALAQTPRGTYTVVASTRGIRLFETSSLQLLRVYGETVSLHGHGIVWQDCFLIRHLQEAEERVRDGTCLQRDDELRHRHDLPNSHDENDLMSHALVVGVPHAFRQPVELRNTLHFWDAAADGKHTAFTLVGPTKADGIGNALYTNNGSLLVSTQQGDCVQMAPTLISEFAGIMYPPGYHVVDDNLVYIEDEDEVDEVVVVNDHHDVAAPQEEASVVEDELAEALRKSVEEQRIQQELLREQVDVVDNNDVESAMIYVPCHPEPHLQQRLLYDNKDRCSDETRSSCDSPVLLNQDASFAEHYLSLLPQWDLAVDACETKPLEATMEEKAAAAPPPLVRPARNKRTRTANLEALMKASIRPELRSYMTSRQQWANGRQSSLSDRARTNAAVAERNGDSCLQQQQPVLVEEHTTKDSLPVSSEESVSSETKTMSSEKSDRPGSSDVVDGERVSCAAEVALTPSTTMSLATLDESSGEKTKASSPADQTAATSNQVDPKTNDSQDDGAAEPLGSSNHDETHSSNVVNGNKATEAAEEVPKKNSSSTLNGENGQETAVPVTRTVCDACHGRMVIHVCGKRELPVDFEAIARAEKEKKEREQAEKLRIRAEKRRLADQKRREAKRRKKLEEEARKKREEEEQRRIAKEQVKLAKEADQRRHENSHDKEKRRAEMMQRLIEEQNSRSHLDEEVRTEQAAHGVTGGMTASSYYSNTAHQPQPWMTNNQAPTTSSYQSTDNRNEALEALASLANGFVGTPNASQQSQPSQVGTNVAAPSVAVPRSVDLSYPQYHSQDAPSSFAAPSEQGYYPASAYAARGAATNVAVPNSSQSDQHSYNVGSSHETTPHGFGLAPHQGLPITSSSATGTTTSPFAVDPATASFRAKVRHGFQAMSSNYKETTPADNNNWGESSNTMGGVPANNNHAAVTPMPKNDGS